MEGMPNEKKQLVMKLFDKELVIRQWQTIAAENYCDTCIYKKMAGKNT